MSKAGIFGAGGWTRELGATARAEIGRRFPDLPIDQISREASFYMIARDAEKTAPTPEEARETLTRLASTLRDLRNELDASALKPLKSLIRQSSDDLPIDIDELSDAAYCLECAVAKARTAIPKGRLNTPRTGLVRALAAILLAAGEEPDKRPTGPLCQLTQIVLEDLGERSSDWRKVLGPALESFTGKQREVSTNT